MGRHTRMQDRTDMLDRIVILLLALAGLAERAAGAPALVRCLMLCPLRRADTVAAAFVAGFDTAHPMLPAEPDHHGFDPADALAVAVSLRTLALTLQAIIKQMRTSSSHPRSSSGHGSKVCCRIQILGETGCPLTPCLDTS